MPQSWEFSTARPLPPHRVYHLLMRLALLALAPLLLPAQNRDALITQLNGLARQQTGARAQAVSKIQSKPQALARQQQVRRLLQTLLGPLPAAGPLNVRSLATLPRDGYRIEKVLYDAQPNYPIPANVYVPATPGPHPAVLLTPGHSPAGKAGESVTAANFARNGFVALAWDPIGEGERLQYWEPARKASALGRPTGEHSHAGEKTLALGSPLAAWFLRDASAGLDYLSSRPDVDPKRLGAFGCSGGGTVTAYLAALDPRLAAAATACYLTSATALLESIGPQEAEQSIPNFLSSGLDFPDWVELAAPRPYAIVSTTEDMFPFAGAQSTYDEAARFYSLFGARDQLRFLTGPGRHGALGPIMPKVLQFFADALKPGPTTWSALPPEKPLDLACTRTGQLLEDRNGDSLPTLTARRAASLKPSRDSLPSAILRLTGASVEPRVSHLPRVPVATIDYSPAGLCPLPCPAGTEESKAELLGPYYLLSLRAMLVGKTLLGLRVDQLLEAANQTEARRIDVKASGAAAVAALHAAVLDQRLHLQLDSMLSSYKLIPIERLHKDVSALLAPGVLTAYDLPDLIHALGPRVTLTRPVDAAGLPIAEK